MGELRCCDRGSHSRAVGRGSQGKPARCFWGCRAIGGHEGAAARQPIDQLFLDARGVVGRSVGKWTLVGVLAWQAFPWKTLLML
ncbi:MAG TPA: hypothetical protein PK667_12265 [Nitrosomonas europaea]|uniref:hypothetical protein n=1 Tax=Nitrosomonas europaea TaxID=915 RepID=UPI002BC3C212|nr:hypothetical protein [Nitrosomonas europaea]HRO57348.1 hypothetical protein [Nitrosomonas europaea]HUM74944.1 hypothetical protein [Nitrosomonas europaea]